MESLEKVTEYLKNSLQLLELKGKPIKLLNPNRNANDIITVLSSINATIQNEKSIPHARAKLKNYPALGKYFEDHLTEGLYMLQFWKCDNESFCMKKTELLHRYQHQFQNQQGILLTFH